MKKINLIIALSVVTMGAIVPASILMSSNQNVVENKKIGDDSVDNSQSIDNNNLIFDNNINDLNTNNDNDKSKAIGDIINANSATCTAEDTGLNTNTWMGITGSEFVKFTIIKEWDSSLDVGSVSISGVSANTITSSKLTIPNHIMNDGNRYDVTSIDQKVFQRCTKLTGILTIPASVTFIDNFAFDACSSLVGLDLSDAKSLQTIGRYAIASCSGLAGTLTIPSSLTTIGDSAFSNCSGLTSLDLSNVTNLQTIEGNTFENCSRLTGTLTIPASVTSIKGSAFNGCSGLTGTLTIPANVTSIGASAFQNIGSNNVIFLSKTLPTTLGNNIFGSNNFAITINVPKGTKATWDSTQNILTKLGITNLSQIVESPPIPPTNLTIVGAKDNYVINKEGIISENLTVSSTTPGADLDVNWSLTNAPSGMQISSTGVLTYTGSQILAKTNFNIIATSKIASLNTIKNTSITVNYQDPTNVTVNTITPKKTQIILGEIGSILVDSCSAIVAPNNANQAVTWSIDAKPSWLTIDATTGKITIDSVIDTALVGTSQTITVKATTIDSPNLSGTKTFTLNFVRPAPDTLSIDGLDDSYTLVLGSGALNKQLTAKAMPTYADADVNWSLENAPSGVTITETGMLILNPTTKLNSASFTVKIESNTTSSVIGTKNTSFTVTDASPTNDLNLPLIIGASVGGVVGVAAIAGGITYGVKRNRIKK